MAKATKTNKQKVKRIKLFTVLKFLAIALISLYFIINIFIDFLNFTRVNKDSLLLGNDPSLSLLVRIMEINPNTGYAKIEFTVVEEVVKDSSSTDTSLQNYGLMVFSGGAIVFSDSTMAFENTSRYHTDFVKFENYKTIKLRNYIQKKYTTDPINLKIDASPSGYLFPFDKYLMRVNFELVDNIGKTKYPTIYLKSEDNKFFVSSSIRNITYGRQQTEIQNSFILAFGRPSYVAINFSLIILIAVSIVFWSFYRILSKTSVSAFEILGLNITVLLTFPSLRSILIPSNLEFAPLFDISSTIIWISSFMAILFFFIKDIIAKQNSH